MDFLNNQDRESISLSMLYDKDIISKSTSRYKSLFIKWNISYMVVIVLIYITLVISYNPYVSAIIAFILPILPMAAIKRYYIDDIIIRKYSLSINPSLGNLNNMAGANSSVNTMGAVNSPVNTMAGANLSLNNIAELIYPVISALKFKMSIRKSMIVVFNEKSKYYIIFDYKNGNFNVIPTSATNKSTILIKGSQTIADDASIMVPAIVYTIQKVLRDIDLNNRQAIYEEVISEIHNKVIIAKYDYKNMTKIITSIFGVLAFALIACTNLYYNVSGNDVKKEINTAVENEGYLTDKQMQDLVDEALNKAENNGDSTGNNNAVNSTGSNINNSSNSTADSNNNSASSNNSANNNNSSSNAGDGSTNNSGSNNSSDGNTNNNDTAIRYLDYYNGRYGFAISYPDIFTYEEYPENRDGCILKTNDGLVELRVYGSNNIFNDTAEIMFNRFLENEANVTYKSLFSNSYVVSYIRGNQYFYECVVVGEGSMNVFSISYPSEQAEFFNKIISNLYESFQVGDLSVSH